jgi:peptide/nickel transport system permease protein
VATELQQRGLSRSVALPRTLALPAESPAASEKGLFTEHTSELRAFWNRFSRDKAALGGAIVLILVLAFAVFGRALSPHDPIAQNSLMRMAPPGTGGYLLGGDSLGRDILSRILSGARLSMTVAVVPLIIALTFGLIFGLVSGFYGGPVDMTLSRIMDVLLAFPAILLAIGIVSALGPGLQNAILAIAIIAIPSFARIVRSTVLSIRSHDYIIAARSLGAGDVRIVGRHILPNCIAPVIVLGTMELGRILIFAAALSFLGLGAQPPAPEWGAMLADGRNVLEQAPIVATIPGLAIFIVALSANLVGDGLRDALDPHMRNR